MEAGTAVALISTGLAAIIAVSVPTMTFRLALRQDQVRWLREQRAQVYVDLLTEAHAEREYHTYDTADDEARERMDRRRTDLRLPLRERARLGARGTIFASRTVNALFNGLQTAALQTTLIRPRDEHQRMLARMEVGTAFDKLQTAIRRELGADLIQLDGAPPRGTSSGSGS